MANFFKTKRFSLIAWRATIIATLVCLLGVNVAMAAGGDFDPEFYGGTTYIDSHSGFSSAERDFVALQSDGKIIVAGDVTCNSYCDIIVLRYNADGSPDSTFGINGIQITDLGADEKVYGMVTQADDKIVLSGSSCAIGDIDVECHLFLARYTADGILDSTFQGDGTLVLGNKSTGDNLSIRPNGKIVMSGTIETDPGVFDSAVFQFNPDGSVDRTFGSKGGKTRLFTIDNPSNRTAGRNGFIAIDLYGNNLAIQPDGKIVVAGNVSNKNSLDRLAVTRLLEDGRGVDRSFGRHGIKVTDFVGGYGVSSVDIGPDGKIVLAGSSSQVDGPLDFVLARFNSNGSLDNTFNGTGMVNTDITPNADDIAQDVLIQLDGKILVLGYTNSYGYHENIAFVRYNSDGSLDNTFGSAGVVTMSYNTKNYGSSIALQQDGKYVVAGLSFYIGGTGDTHYFTLSRILP